MSGLAVRDANPGEYAVVLHRRNLMVFFSQKYTEEVLQARWFQHDNEHISSCFGEAHGQGRSFSWDLRVYYFDKQAELREEMIQAMPGQNLRLLDAFEVTDRANPAFRDATGGEYIVLLHAGNPIVFFSRDYTQNVLNGSWYPGTNRNLPESFGEAIKRAGGSYSWDLRLYYLKQQESRWQSLSNARHVAGLVIQLSVQPDEGSSLWNVSSSSLAGNVTASLMLDDDVLLFDAIDQLCAQSAFDAAIMSVILPDGSLAVSQCPTTTIKEIAPKAATQAAEAAIQTGEAEAATATVSTPRRKAKQSELANGPKAKTAQTPTASTNLLGGPEVGLTPHDLLFELESSGV